MKILSGTFKGRNFFMPEGVRPTQNIVRKAVFDMLGQDIEGLTFLELFAGSGAMGLEALSRHAAQVVWVEKDFRCAQVIEENLKVLNVNAHGSPRVAVEVIAGDVFVVIKQLAKQNKTFDIIFLDPPYDAELTKKTLKTLGAHDILHPNSFVIVEHCASENLPDLAGRFFLVRQRRHGGSVLSILQKASVSEG